MPKTKKVYTERINYGVLPGTRARFEAIAEFAGKHASEVFRDVLRDGLDIAEAAMQKAEEEERKMREAAEAEREAQERAEAERKAAKKKKPAPASYPTGSARDAARAGAPDHSQA